MLGSDHAASLEYHEFKQLVDVCKKIKISLGSSVKKFNKSEQVLQNILLRKFVLSKNITKGAKLTKNNFKTALTMTKYGIHPKFYYNLLGKKVKRNLNKGHVLKLSDIK